MTYTELQRVVREHLGVDAAIRLDSAVRDEAEALTGPARSVSGRVNAADWQRVTTDAQEYYTTEILASFRLGSELKPLDVLDYRRRATAWAFAELLRKAGVSL